MTDNQSDIVERVRAFIIIDEARSNNTVAREAADEIERLRKRNRELIDQMENLHRAWRREVMSEPLVHTDKDREYANDLLEDLDIKPTGLQLEIATQWFCKARVEQALERGGGKS